MLDWTEMAMAVLIAGVVLSLAMLAAESRETTPELLDPRADARAVSASLAALGGQLVPGGRADWLAVELGGERAAVEALVRDLHPGLPEQGPFAVNRLVAHAPLRVAGQVRGGVPVITSVERLDIPARL